MKLKTVHDYYEAMYNKFPYLSQKDIRKIINFGWKSLYLLNSYGGDVLISDLEFLCFFGKLTSNSIYHYLHYIKKLSNKLRILYKRRKLEWDQYYYFALSEDDYNKYMLNKPKGRPRKKFSLENIMFYKIYDECIINEMSRPYVFKIKYLTDLGFKFFLPKIEITNPILVEKHRPYKMKDILTSNYKYKFL